MRYAFLATLLLFAFPALAQNDLHEPVRADSLCVTLTMIPPKTVCYEALDTLAPGGAPPPTLCQWEDGEYRILKAYRWESTSGESYEEGGEWVPVQINSCDGTLRIKPD